MTAPSYRRPDVSDARLSSSEREAHRSYVRITKLTLLSAWTVIA